jgi:hypothetical protein
MTTEIISSLCKARTRIITKYDEEPEKTFFSLFFRLFDVSSQKQIT